MLFELCLSVKFVDLKKFEEICNKEEGKFKDLELIKKMLKENPHERINANELLENKNLLEQKSISQDSNQLCFSSKM